MTRLLYCVPICALISFPTIATAQPVAVEGPDIANTVPVIKLEGSDPTILTARSAQFSVEKGALDIGTVPALKLHEIMRYMNAQNAAGFSLINDSSTTVEVAKLRFIDVKTEEAENPFDGCSPEEMQPYQIGPGEYSFETICFFPEITAQSSATAQFLDSQGNVIASIPVTGQGGVLEKDAPLPMGLAKIPIGHFTSPGKEDEPFVLENGVLIGEEFQDIPIGLQVKQGLCWGAIFGGGQRPNPAVAAGLGRAFNTNALKLDQGTQADPINVGEHVILGAKIECNPKPNAIITNIQWTIGGMSIKDYDDSIGTGGVRTIAHTPADLKGRQLNLYWQRPGVHDVTADISYTRLGVAQKVKVTRKFTVEINNNDIDRQMEDFYTWNHKGRILVQHVNWHFGNASGRCLSVGGADFFVFHRKFLGSADGWRKTFGPYPAIIGWNPAQAIPNQPTAIKHARRNNNNPNLPRPSYYTRAGGAAVANCVNPAVRQLKKFTSADDLAKQMEHLWHNVLHGRIGGDMGSATVAPKDPIFFRWHKTIDNVYDDYIRP